MIIVLLSLFFMLWNTEHFSY